MIEIRKMTFGYCNYLIFSKINLGEQDVSFRNGTEKGPLFFKIIPSTGCKPKIIFLRHIKQLNSEI